MTEEPFSIMPKIKNAGAIFLGKYSPEPVGDYMAGPNHVLPTGGTAKFFSPLGVYDFCKRSSIIAFSKENFDKLKEHVSMFAKLEGLYSHSKSIEIRDSK
jgi:histidinol dehydrogenase